MKKPISYTSILRTLFEKEGPLKNHYIRTNLGNKRLVGVLNSAVFAALPVDKLLTVEDAFYYVTSNPDVPNEIKNMKAFQGVFTQLVKEGCVKEVVGVRLQKFLETF